jgi:hypothetical protein
MPPVSQAQRAAMYAAKAGKSTLGIPQKVGAEFVAADPDGKLPARVGKQPQSDALGNVDAKPPHPFGKFKKPKLRIGSKTYG